MTIKERAPLAGALSYLIYTRKKVITMRDSFSFCGVDVEEIGLEYAPENKDTYVYRPAIENIHEETFEGHDGGYAYGAYKEPKEFILRCFYEQEHIATGLMSRVHSLFRVGKAGLLVFKRRPWCYYYATVTNVNTDEMYSYLNGLIVITMKAYYPYARGIEINGRMFSNVIGDPYHTEVMQNTALMDKDELVPQMSFDNISSQMDIILLNPGTERAKVSLVIAGQAGDGVTIYNKTTDQLCKYVAFNTETNEYIYTDGFSGKTVLDNGSQRTLAFLYHDYGFIELEPSFPAKRDIHASYDGTVVIATNMLYNDEYEREWYTDKYIYLNGWFKIQECVDQHTLVVLPNNGTIPGNGDIQTTVCLMNELTIKPTQGSLITRLNFIYKPTFA